MNDIRKKDPGGLPNVLVFEADEATRTSMREMLAEAGFSVAAASEPREALQLLMSGNVDVLVADHEGAGAPGRAVVNEVRTFWPWIGIVLAARDPTDELRARARELGVDEVLAKPVDAAALRRRVTDEHARMKRRTEGSAGDGMTLQTQLGLLRRFSETAANAENLNQALMNLSLGMAQLLPCAVIGVLDVIHPKTELVIDVVEEVAAGFVARVEEEMIRRYEMLTGRNLSDESIHIEHQGVPLSDAAPRQPGTIFSVPIITDREVHGLLTLAAVKEDAFQGRETAFLYHAANYFSSVLVAFSQVRRMAVRDSLTGLLNRRGMEEEFERAWQLARRYRHGMGVVTVDLDYFKTLNDTYGHSSGDEVLKEFSELLGRVTRDADIIGRHGGDEMLVILPIATAADIRAFVERLIAEIRQHTFCRRTHALRLTASVGAAGGFPSGDGISAADLLRQADQAMYLAKRSGRDRYCLWRDLQGTKAAGEPEAPKPVEAPRPGGRVLVVDDNEDIRGLVAQMLANESYQVAVEAGSAGTLARLAEKREQFDVVLVDIQLAGESGFDLLEQIERIDPTIVRIVITGYTTTSNVITSLRRGAYDFIGKPFTGPQLIATVDRAMEYRRLLIENRNYQLHLQEMVNERSAELSKALLEVRNSYTFTLEALAALVDAREHQTGKHSVRVAALSRILAESLGLPNKAVDEIADGALLHDIGKIAVPDSVLLKPGPLTGEEWKLMRMHPEIGYKILRPSPYHERASQIVYEHQERYDGSGYPRGLRGKEICLGARIFAVADAYDAMRSDRTYSKGRSRQEAVEEITRLSGVQFDPTVVEAFLKCLPEIEKAGDWPAVEAVRHETT